MQIEVSTETWRQIEELLRTGRFRNAEEVIVHALDAAQDYIERVAPLIAEGLVAQQEGRTRDVTPALADEIIAAGVQRSSARLGRTG